MIDNIVRPVPDQKVEIIVTQQSGRQHRVIIDAFDFDRLGRPHLIMHRSRHKRDEWYCKTTYEGRSWLLHRLILRTHLATGLTINHLDFCGLNNSRDNIHAVTHKQQMEHQRRNQGKFPPFTVHRLKWPIPPFTITPEEFAEIKAQAIADAVTMIETGTRNAVAVPPERQAETQGRLERHIYHVNAIRDNSIKYWESVCQSLS